MGARSILGVISLIRIVNFVLGYLWRALNRPKNSPKSLSKVSEVNFKTTTVTSKSLRSRFLKWPSVNFGRFQKKTAPMYSGRLNGSVDYRVFSKVKSSTTALACLPGSHFFGAAVVPGLLISKTLNLIAMLLLVPFPWQYQVAELVKMPCRHWRFWRFCRNHRVLQKRLTKSETGIP